ncbi:MAG TPA: M56 family metallopeptidase [Mucilaginibacter sp.]|jgi:beta-lactamase regulating signal transducer with metallopeptidase domain|nr:M56 family metallopeptidase [Mucilaginibacter sp.]
MENGLQQLLPDHIARALCDTLLHSLWQGLVLAALTGLVIVATKRSRPAARYRLLVAFLSLFTLAFIYTLILELNSPAVSVAAVGKQGPSITLSDLLNYFLAYLQEHAGFIVAIWLMVICLKSARLIFGLYSLERLRTKKVGRLDPQWENRITQMAETFGIKQTVSLLESGIAKVPLVIGYLKPVILIPVGLVNALGPQEVEAILLHEMAHISRRDYLVNLLQSFVETLFFFNPAVLWLSSLIRAERENCCDDIAVDHTRNKAGYIRALVHFEEYQLLAPGYVQALTGKNGMLQRMQRMTANHNRSLNKLEVAGLSLLLLVSGLIIAAKPADRSGMVPKEIHNAAPMSLEQRYYLHEKELAARKQFLKRKVAEGTATRADALELLRYDPPTQPAMQHDPVPVSPQLRKYIHDREVAAATQPGAVPLTPEFKKYIIERDIAMQKYQQQKRAEEADKYRKRQTDSIP